ncbi:MAG: hypothetical protein QM724_12115 [Flavobacteriales bacterium]
MEMLMAEKAYLIFSHTIKKQPHNRQLLRTVLDRNITLIDHELLTDAKGERVLAFGRWAGVVGAYNAFRAWQATEGGPALRPAHQCHDRAEIGPQPLAPSAAEGPAHRAHRRRPRGQGRDGDPGPRRCKARGAR